MKALSKPLSSPGRTEKFPPPLMMRFLRGNVGSRSRGRSRSSPMFYLRSRKSLPGAIEATQEPSSPKVTCIGQVRVRRSAKSKGRRTGGAAARRRRCWWLKKALFCGKFSLRFHGRPFRGFFRKWGSFFRSGCCKKVEVAEDSNARTEKIEKIVDGENRASSSSNNSERDDYNNKYENLGAGSREIERGFLESSSSSPPRNALILTRCRSAPYRSSSLGGRFWAQNEEDNGTENEEDKSEKLANPISENEPRISQEMEIAEKNVEDLKINAGGAVHPLLLTRCKSEPARTGERLIVNQESKLILMQRRLDDDVDNPCSQ